MFVKLKVKRLEHLCFFELEWGENQQITNSASYPPDLDLAYQEWRQSYLNFYQFALRGRVAGQGRIATTSKDWRSQLVQAEAKLLKIFQHWLRNADLFEIRTQIIKIATQSSARLNIFLSCQDTSLERLPWETWEIALESPLSFELSWVRLPPSIRQKAVFPKREKARILIILGDDTALDFQGDREAIAVLDSLVEMEVISSADCPKQQDLKQQICDAIAHPTGWDILLFAGHSNETELTGGEFAIAPQTFLSLTEIQPYLLQAKENGLQFALFNSCSGLSIAKTLIDLGLSQVAILREPIHNNVAQVFLSQFLKSLAHFQDVQDCLKQATQFLATKASLQYPSAYLVPCLFYHPGSQPFRLKPPQKVQKRLLKKLKPHPLEAIALSAIALLSLLFPVQDWLLSQRLLMQSRYRDMTQQIPTQPPPVLLISIDEASLLKQGIADPNPIDRQYLAQIINQLNDAGATAIGIDYILSRSHEQYDPEGDKKLREAIARSPETKFVFASMHDEISGWLTVHPNVARSDEVLYGQIHFIPWLVWQIDHKPPQQWHWPFSYLIALSYEVSQQQEAPLVFEKETDALTQLRRYIQTHSNRDELTFLSSRMRQNWLTLFSYQLQQMWLEPIIDFSIPPSQVYEDIPAWQVLENPSLTHLSQQAVIIASGGYNEATVLGNSRENDRFAIHPAANYWLEKESRNLSRRYFTGGQVHAYLLHHYLRDRLVIPLPDIWMIIVAIILGKTLILTLDTHHLQSSQRYRWAVGIILGLAIYGGLSLQLYITAAIALPWLLPSLAFTIALSPLGQPSRNKLQLGQERLYYKQMVNDP
ncbi:MAG: CHASE2 domain-containing protein [Jaaginema sp. PMC 1079.18]|nr:CHASE2 domain-containing protein [Jaaginema sp. PMC 1080.18]MEC4850841.1 CHASE2 domain-containing protein [Jaaginema sp. PMC 1079.18]MEC4867284.1 CHASE2 domain-containing protein [Jaaginema sp. PMC 1078.18]